MQLAPSSLDWKLSVHGKLSPPNEEGAPAGVIDDLFSIRSKVAVVTGGSRGIGLMIARAYVDAGARVYISSRKAEVCDRIAAELSANGECISIPADL